jgi:hypothetical protein
MSKNKTIEKILSLFKEESWGELNLRMLGFPDSKYLMI